MTCPTRPHVTLSAMAAAFAVLAGSWLIAGAVGYAIYRCFGWLVSMAVR